MELIKKYKQDILKEFDNVCNTYKIIGTPVENPRFYNISEFNTSDNRLYFKSTQRSESFFSIPINKKDIDNMHFEVLENYQEIWKWFKEIRTNFLIKNHPTIKY